MALLALAVTRGSPEAAGSGLLFGLTCYLSYGLTLFAVIGAAVLMLSRRRIRERSVLLAPLAAGLAVTPLAFTLAGFGCWEAYHLLVTRYYQGVGGIRPYGYWVWADLAGTVIITGLATAAGLARAGSALARQRGAALSRPDGTGGPDGSSGPDRTGGPAAARLALLLAAALLPLLAADLSGMSKAETERIWLPFAMWLLACCASLDRPRVRLTTQALLALLVNHLLLTGW